MFVLFGKASRALVRCGTMVAVRGARVKAAEMRPLRIPAERNPGLVPRAGGAAVPGAVYDTALGAGKERAMNRRLVALSGVARSCWVAGVGLASAAAVLAYSALQVRADGVPATAPLVYSGVLQENDQAASGYHAIGMGLYDAAADGTAQCALAAVPLSVEAGHFALVLDDACAKAVHQKSDLWVELQVDGQTLLPRTKIAAVPYALEAGRAVDAAGALRAELDATKSALASLQGRLATLEQKGRPRFVYTRDARAGCPGGYAHDTDMVAHTFTTAGPATIHPSGDIIACAAGREDVYLVVDGNEVNRTLGNPNGPGGDCWVPMHVDAVVDVGPGDHTVSIRGTVDNIYGCGEGWGHIQTVIFE
jgi:hypothetical protein